MLRIDETSGTLVAPEAALGTEPELGRNELLGLIAGGWTAFAAEVGRPGLHLAVAAPAPGIDLLAIDEAGGSVTVVSVGGRLEAALHGAATVAGWDAERLAGLHPKLTAAVPGASPAVMLIGSAFDEDVLTTLDWLARRHGLDATAHRARLLRFGAERLLDVSSAYPQAGGPAEPSFLAALAPPEAAAADAAMPAPPAEAARAAAHSAPPPGVGA